MDAYTPLTFLKTLICITLRRIKIGGGSMRQFVKTIKTIGPMSMVFFLLSPSSSSATEQSDYNSKLGFGFRTGEIGKLEAGKDYVPNELIVAFYEGKDLKDIMHIANNFGGVKVKEIKGAVLFRFPSEASMMDAAIALIKNPAVRYVERNGIAKIPPVPELNIRKKGTLEVNSSTEIQTVSSDAGTSYQYHLTIIRKTAINATPTQYPTVAVLDTGVDYTHPDLQGKVILGKNCIDGSMDPFDDHGHGTHVAGIIGAKAGNRIYGEGVCPECQILAVKVCTAGGLCTDFDMACGMQYARMHNSTKVINMSIRTYYLSKILEDEIKAIKNAGKILVAAAGNDNTSEPAYPAAHPDTAFGVMATEQNDCRTYFSNFSPPDNPTRYNIAAPGWKILSTLPDASFGLMSGTSMAAPIVAGAVALVWAHFPHLSREQIIERILNNSQPITCGFPGYTAKRIDIRRALTGRAETRTVIGRLIDPFTGKAPAVPLATARVFSGTTELGRDVINHAGFYEISLTGNVTTGLTLRALKNGYVTRNLRLFNLSFNRVTGPFTDAYPKLRNGYVTITLDWKNFQPHTKDIKNLCADNCLGWEFDLYIKTPSGVYIYYGYPGSLNSYPYVYLPRDSFRIYEPLETIVIGPNAENGEYHVFVGRYKSEYLFTQKWDESKASVQVFVGDTLRAVFNNPPQNCGSSEYWYVGKVIKSGNEIKWETINRCSDQKP